MIHYSDARDAMVLAAKSEFDSCSSQVVAVTNAWYAVGVGPAFDGVTTITGVNQEPDILHCLVRNYRWDLIGGDEGTSYSWYTKNLTQGQTSFTHFKTTPSEPTGSGGDGSCDLIEVRVDVINAGNTSGKCATASFTFSSDLCPLYELPDCDEMMLMVSPNPSLGDAMLQLKDFSDHAAKATKKHTIVKIRITDKTGRIKKQIDGNRLDKMNISLTGLPADVYTVSVFNGKSWLSRQIIKQ